MAGGAIALGVWVNVWVADAVVVGTELMMMSVGVIVLGIGHVFVDVWLGDSVDEDVGETGRVGVAVGSGLRVAVGVSGGIAVGVGVKVGGRGSVSVGCRVAVAVVGLSSSGGTAA
jgi:hypothetical protein